MFDVVAVLPVLPRGIERAFLEDQCELNNLRSIEKETSAN